MTSDLLKNLESEDEADRICAVEDLAATGDVSVVAPLIERLKIDSSRAVQESIFLALEQMEVPDICERMVGLFESDKTYLCNQASNVLRKNPEQALPCLEETMNHRSPDVRKFALDTLAGFNSPIASHIYAKALDDSDMNVIITAVEQTGLHRLADLKQSVEKHFSETDVSMLQSACLEALSQIGDADSWHLICQKYPTIESIPGYLIGIWLMALGSLCPADDRNYFEAFLADAALMELYAPEFIHAFEQHTEQKTTPADPAAAASPMPPSLGTGLLQLAQKNKLEPVYQAKLCGLLAAQFTENETIQTWLDGALPQFPTLVRHGILSAWLEKPGCARSMLEKHLANETDPEIRELIEKRFSR